MSKSFPASASTCSTHRRVKKIAYTWIIEDYINCYDDLFVNKDDVLQSPIFLCEEDKKLQWRLLLYPKKLIDPTTGGYYTNSLPGYLSVFLQLQSSDGSVESKFSISLLNKDRSKLTESSLFNKFSSMQKYGFVNFFSRTSLSAGQSLILHCNITVFGDPVHKECHYSDIQLQIPECKISQDYGQLLEDQTLCDIVLSVRGKELNAHKTVLVARCPVFRAMFQHEMEEQKTGRVEITDIDYEVLQEMIYFIYTGKVRNIGAICKELLAAADKYQLDRLKVMCEETLRSKMSVVNAAEILVLADMYRADQLRSRAIDFINLHSVDVRNTDGWKSLVVDKPQVAIQYFLESLSIPQAKAT